jgi:Protein of unknown function (DUF3631)
VALVAAAADTEQSLGIQLLADQRTVFGDTEVLATETILEPLHALEESPWVDLRGKPLDARGLSNRLGKYELRPKSVRLDGGHLGLVPAMTVSMSPPWRASSALI